MGTDLNFSIQKKGNLDSSGIDCISNVEHAVSYFHWYEDDLLYNGDYDDHAFPECVWEVFRSKSSKAPDDNEKYVYRLDHSDLEKIIKDLKEIHQHPTKEFDQYNVECIWDLFYNAYKLDPNEYELWFKYC